MPVILTATDFSEIANNAVRYACSLAKQQGLSVTVVHAFIIRVTFTDTPMPMVPADEARKIAEDRMAVLQVQLKTEFEGLQIAGKVLYGELIDCLEEYIEEDTVPWLVVLGNTKPEDHLLWMASTILSAVKNLQCPVMAVPLEAKYRDVKQLCLACDLEKVTDRFPSSQLDQIVAQTGAKLHVLNTGHAVKDNTIMESEELHSYLASMNPQYHNIDATNTEDAIEQFVESNNIDWLIVTPHKHSFFETLFHKHHTETMARISHIPLVALHERE